MITMGEIQFIKELIQELCLLAEPSEYYEGEVQDAYTILDKLSKFDFEQTVSIYYQIEEINKNGND